MADSPPKLGSQGISTKLFYRVVDDLSSVWWSPIPPPLEGNNRWRFTGVYGWSNRSDKHHTLGLLFWLAEDPHEAWLCAGDFNLLFNLDDKEGGLPAVLSEVLSFRTEIESCNLYEMTTSDSRFTWDNGRLGQDFIQKRIDLAFSNGRWRDLHPGAYVVNLDRCGSDHEPIKILLNAGDVGDSHTGLRPFRFESMWIDDESCLEVVSNAWRNPGSSTALPGIMGKVSRCAADLKAWDYAVFGNVNESLRKRGRN